MMRTAALVLAGASVLTGCAGQGAYGPTSDERLEMATDGIQAGSEDVDESNAQHLERIRSASCEKAAAELGKMAKGQASEEERLAALTGILRELRLHKNALDTEFEGHPGLKYFSGRAADGATYDVPSLVSTCDTSLYDAESRLDALVRDVVRMPVVEEIEGSGRRKRVVSKARVDFALLETAVTTLAPVDQDALKAEIDAAAKRLADDRNAKKRTHRRRRRR